MPLARIKPAKHQGVNLYRPGLLTTTKWDQHNTMDHHKLYSAATPESRWDGWMATKLLNCIYIDNSIYIYIFHTLIFYFIFYRKPIITCFIITLRMSCKLVHVLSYCGVSIAYNKRRYDMI